MTLNLENAQYLNNYTKTDFGYFVFDLKRKLYYENNHLYISKITPFLLEVLNSFHFYYAIVEVEIINELDLAVEHEKMNVLKHVRKIPAVKDFKNYTIRKAQIEDLEKVELFESQQQIEQFENYFNFVDEDFYRQQNLYIILDKDKIIASFRDYDNQVFENVVTITKYRKQGIMRNYLNYISDKTHRLVCYDESLPFYEKAGFKLDYIIDEYTTQNVEELKSKLKQYLKET